MNNKSLLKKIITDFKNKTSYSVDYLKNDSVNKTLSKKGIKIRQFFSPVLRLIYCTQTEYKLVQDNKNMFKKNSSKIYIINHRQADDIVLGANAIGENGYIVFGNEKLVFDTTNGIGLWANGMILLNRNNYESRKSTYEKMKFVLQNGGNVIIYPEGYWNLDDNGLSDDRHLSDDHNSENWLIQDINIGVIRLAKEMGCPIIPVILHYDEITKKRCYSKIGKEYFINKDDDIFVKKDEIVVEMQSIYYELMEKYSSYQRTDLEKEGITLKEKWQELKKALISDCDINSINYHLDLENEKLIGKAKVGNPVISNEEAFSHLDSLNYNKDNAYLLSKKLTGRKYSR